MTKVYIIAGEKSGDLHGSHLVEEMRQKDPELNFYGVAGPLMRDKNVISSIHMENFQVMGFSDVLFALPRLIRLFYKVKKEILQLAPDYVVFIDYPGFNLKMAKHLRKAGFTKKLVQYICPSVWAWKKGRIQEMEKSLDLLLTIYPFEKAYFENTTLAVNYVGNPLHHYLEQHAYDPEWKKNYPLLTNKILAIFPGSRKGEIAKNFLKQLQAAHLYQLQDSSISIAVSVANVDQKKLLQDIVKKSPIKKVEWIDKKHTYDLMKDSFLALAKSGTVTLELALHKCPTVVVYELSALNYWIAKYVIRLNLPFYCIVNIITKKQVFIELIGKNVTAEKIAKALIELSKSEEQIQCKQACLNIKQLFSDNNPAKNAAFAILDEVSSK